MKTKGIPLWLAFVLIVLAVFCMLILFVNLAYGQEQDPPPPPGCREKLNIVWGEDSNVIGWGGYEVRAPYLLCGAAVKVLGEWHVATWDTVGDCAEQASGDNLCGATWEDGTRIVMKTTNGIQGFYATVPDDLRLYAGIIWIPVTNNTLTRTPGWTPPARATPTPTMPPTGITATPTLMFPLTSRVLIPQVMRDWGVCIPGCVGPPPLP